MQSDVRHRAGEGMNTRERQVTQRQNILSEFKAPALQRELTSHVRAYCIERYDDPQIAERDMCKALGGVHCVAIDSPYSHVEQGESICKQFRQLPPMKSIEAVQAPAPTAATGNRICAYCKRPYKPTGNRQKYCPACKALGTRQADSARQRQYRDKNQNCHDLDPVKPS